MPPVVHMNPVRSWEEVLVGSDLTVLKMKVCSC